MGAELEKGRNLWAESSGGQIRKGPKPLATKQTRELILVTAILGKNGYNRLKWKVWLYIGYFSLSVDLIGEKNQVILEYIIMLNSRDKKLCLHEDNCLSPFAKAGDIKTHSSVRPSICRHKKL